MQTFQNTVTIARPVGEVFAFLADPRNIPRWNYAIACTVPTSPGPVGAGATYRQTRTIPRRSEESLQITVFQPPRPPRHPGTARPVPRHGQLGAAISGEPSSVVGARRAPRRATGRRISGNGLLAGGAVD